MDLIHFFSIRNIMDNFGLFYVNGHPFLMMVWNLFLAIVPFFIFLSLENYWRKTKLKTNWQKIIAAVVFFLWFIFLPNSAYLIVGIRHLLNFCPADLSDSICVFGAWEIMYFFVFSVIGWIFFIIFLKQMQVLLAKIFSPKISRRVILAIIPFVSLGVLLGLTERFNSWDIIYRPLAIWGNLLRYMTTWAYFRNFLVFTAGYYLLFFLGEYLFGKKVIG
jgi:uncharacterized membrane protein